MNNVAKHFLNLYYGNLHENVALHAKVLCCFSPTINYYLYDQQRAQKRAECKKVNTKKFIAKLLVGSSGFSHKFNSINLWKWCDIKSHDKRLAAHMKWNFKEEKFSFRLSFMSEILFPNDCEIIFWFTFNGDLVEFNLNFCLIANFFLLSFRVLHFLVSGFISRMSDLFCGRMRNALREKFN